MADVKVYLMATAGGHTTPNQDDFSVARNAVSIYEALFGPGAIVNIPYNTPANPDISRDAPWLYVGKTNYLSNPSDPNSIVVQSDTAFTLFDLYSIPSNRVIKKVRLLVWIGGGFNDIPWEMNIGYNPFHLGVIKWNWGTTYPFNPAYGIPDDDLGDSVFLSNLYEPNNNGKDWWVRMLKQSDDSALTPANCANYNLERISVDGDPANYRYYMALPMRPEWFPSVWGGSPGDAYYRIAVCYDLWGKLYTNSSEKSWIKFGSANKSPGAERCFLEVTYGDAAGEAVGTGHGYFEVPAPIVVLKKLAPLTTKDAHAYFEAIAAGLPTRVSASITSHAYFESIYITRRFAPSTSIDAHSYFENVPVNATEVRIEADAHAYFEIAELIQNRVSIEEDAHAYFEISPNEAPYNFLLVLRNFSTSKVIPFTKIENIIPLTGVIQCTFTFAGNISSVKAKLTTTPLAIKMNFAGNLIVAHDVSVNVRIRMELEGTFNTRGDS